jgi:mono/diheme cytochrome c family protein
MRFRAENRRSPPTGIFTIGKTALQDASMQVAPPHEQAYTSHSSQCSARSGMLRKSILLVMLILFGKLAYADAIPERAATRGELLYSTHCVACHSTQVHWQDKKIAKDWKSLRAEVLRWQKFSGLRWSNDDIAAVARYLNALYYHYPAPNLQ